MPLEFARKSNSGEAIDKDLWLTARLKTDQYRTQKNTNDLLEGIKAGRTPNQVRFRPPLYRTGRNGGGHW